MINVVFNDSLEYKCMCVCFFEQISHIKQCDSTVKTVQVTAGSKLDFIQFSNYGYMLKFELDRRMPINVKIIFVIRRISAKIDEIYKL